MPGVYVAEMPPAARMAPLPSDVALFAGRTSLPPNLADPSPLLRSPADFAAWHGAAAPGDAAAAMLQDAVHAYFASGGAKLRIAPVASLDLAGLASTLEVSAGLRDVATVAAPGGWLLAGADPRSVAQILLAHVARPGSRRFAIVDPPAQYDVATIRTWRAGLDSRDAALYHPWIVAPDAHGATATQPPSGFVAGIYAAVDRARGVAKAPANEVVPTATALAASLTLAQQELLNPRGINCIVAQTGRGIRLWGARTLGSDPDWKYVNVRRLVRWIASSIEDGIGWAQFEPNEDETWARVRRVVETFLLTLWRDGALCGVKPEHGFFVRCDRATMSQSDIDAGRLICEIGIAPVRPSEFVIVRIATHTADRPPS